MEWDDAPRADSDEATRLPLLLRQALHAVDGLVVSALAAEGFSELGVVAANALVLVAGGWRGKPITTVATDLRISPQAAGRLVAGLEAADLVYRVPHPRDARPSFSV